MHICYTTLDISTNMAADSGGDHPRKFQTKLQSARDIINFLGVVLEVTLLNQSEHK